MKEIFKDLVIATLTSFSIPIAFYIGIRMTPLKKAVSGMYKLGQRAAAPVSDGAKRVSGRIAHWGAGRGFFGRTAARFATGAWFPGGRAQMERVGEGYRKNSTERMIARGSYRLQPNAKMNAEALERVAPDAIKRWVNSDNPETQKAVKALRQMVVDSQGAIKLSTAQREALFSGGADVPDTTLPRVAPGAPVRTRAQNDPYGLGGPSELPAVDSVREGGAFSSWWGSRPTVVPGRMVRGQSLGRWVAGHGQAWGKWLGRGVSSSPTGLSSPTAPGMPDPLNPSGPPLPPPDTRRARPGF